MRCSSSRHLAAAAIFYVVAGCVSAVNVTIPVSAPIDAQPLSSTLVAFSLEQDRWPDWTGVEARNNFTFNALSNYAELTGQPPDIRVGANSEDHTVWSPTETLNQDIFPTPNKIEPYPEATQITVGDAYYGLSRYLPKGTHMVWGVNLGGNNATNAANMAKAIVNSFRSPDVSAAGVILDRLEIGNEADLYTSNGLRKKGWDVEDYVAEWTDSANAVANAVGLSDRNAPVTIQGAAFANQGFTPRDIYNLGILDTVAGKAISTISQHHYQAHFCNGGSFSLVSFMNKLSIRSNLSIFDADISATRERGIDYVLGETNSIACHGAPGVSNVAGAAVWAVDYILQAATKQIKKTYFHHGIGYKYNFFQPVQLNRSIITGGALDTPELPHLHPTYYAGLVVNTLIGRTGSAHIVELNVSHASVSGYAAYENGTLARLVFVNLDAWLQGSEGPRPSVNVALGLAGDARAVANRTVVARRLAIQHADDTANLTWAGRSFETADALPTGEAVEEPVVLAEGVYVRATEAVLIDFVDPAANGSTPSAPTTGAIANDTGRSSPNRTPGYIAAGVVSGAIAAIVAGISVLCYMRGRSALSSTEQKA